MATKLFCDGCDQEISLAEAKIVNINSMRSTFLDDVTIRFDFCDGCAKIWASHFYPNCWPRAKPQASER